MFNNSNALGTDSKAPRSPHAYGDQPPITAEYDHARRCCGELTAEVSGWKLDRSSLHDAVRAFVTARIDAATETRLTATGLADAFTRARIERGAWVVVPEEQRVGQYIGLTQVVREQLRLLVPERPESDLLKAYYLVRGEGGEEYCVLRTELTKGEMRQIVTRLRALSVHYDRHALALETH
jgi:hypothetical protein